MKSVVAFLLLAVATAQAEPLFPFVLPWDDASPGLVNAASWSGPVLPVTVGADGHFVAGRERIRFLGVNLCFGACFPQQEDAPKIAARMAKFGINIVRFHHMDMQRFPNGIWAGSRQLSPEALARLDFFIAQLQRRGIYVNLNLLVSRQFTAADGLPAEIEKVGWKEQATVGFFSTPALELQKEYARALLTHQNPHTGRTYAEEPGVACVEIHNENGLIHSWLGGVIDELPAVFQRDLQLRWNVWLRQRYGTTDKLRAAWNARAEPVGDEMLTAAPEKWLLEQHEGAAAIASTTNGVTELRVQKPGSADWHVQWNLPGLLVVSNMTYTLTFRAKTDAARTLGAALNEAHEPWQSLGLHATAALTTEWQTFRFVFNALGSDANSRVLFTGLGTQTGRVWLADISLRPGGVHGLGADERFETGKVPFFPKARIGEWTDTAQRDWIRFLWETEDRYWQAMRSFLKDDLKVQAPIMGTIVGCSTPNLMARLDAVDSHAYWQHPHFPGRPWDAADWTVGNQSMVNEPHGGVLPGLAMRRVLGKPHCVTEYNHAAPNTFGSEAAPLLAAYAALQDWDAIYLFCYSHRTDDWDARRIPNFFDIDQHPNKFVTMIPAAAMFRRADIKPAREQITVGLDKDREVQLLRRARPWSLINAADAGLPAAIALVHRVAISTGKTVSSLTEVPTRLVSDTGELSWGERLVTINSPRSKALIGYSAGRKHRLGHITVEPAATMQNGWSAITLTELEPGRWLVTATGYTENTGAVWKNAEKTSLGANWGKAPSLVEGISARLTFNAPVKAWALDERGQRGAALPASNSVELGPQHKTIWYEVATDR